MLLYNENMLESNSERADEMIKSLMRREGDVLQDNFMRYRSVARDVFRDLNLNAIKWTERRMMAIDKATNSVNMGCNYLHLSSISIIDDCGKLKTLVINRNLKDDIVDVSSKKTCACECGCNDDLCGLIKNYEAIQEDVTETMPDDSTKVFTKIMRKILYPGGALMVSNTYPIRVYEDGVWTDTINKTDNELLCNLEVKPCGCLLNSQKNKDTLNACSHGDTIETDWGCTVDPKCKEICASELTYNFSEEGDRIILPSNFTHDKVLVRTFVEPTIKEIRVPLMAKSAYLAGLKYFVTEYDDRVPQGRAKSYETGYNNKKDKLKLDLHKCSLKEIYDALTPYRVMP